jgi:hydrogenase/urease accessory protein HupE
MKLFANKLVRHRSSFCLLTIFVLLVAVSKIASAHDARPLSVFIVEQEPHIYRIDLRMPPSVDAANRPEISFPEGCMVHSGVVREATDAFAQTAIAACPALQDGIEGQRIGVHYTLYNPSLSTLLRFSPLSGGTRTAVLPPDQSEWQVPPAANWKTVAHDYLLLGIQHIWGGIDHLLFVAGLLLLARTPRRIVTAVTGFTLAHSITLSLSALGIVRLPIPPIEAGIALSILFLAREIARPDNESLARRYPLAISCFFGLLHGFGFAAALREAGLPQNEIAAALLFFNAGVEVGQLVFIAVVFVLMTIAAGLVMRKAGTLSPSISSLEGLCGYALGVPAAFWFIARVQMFWFR